ncbi:exported protein of unknown function [Streptomyces ambofaciens ATCC 23877]|uniref:Uncharacterized protein n=1 Tax=Streptomyces ambofaciens (strain ATCC 23877 / 3486 / DSM 40053 / JCM 4204 / NBRC 12836 / NRRL B-2516) TaxID=278992 RepID=A0A0K2B156_STRA7|nr:exported protein of unknown function [Streptomyces ambofaciens ATCC 23877]
MGRSTPGARRAMGPSGPAVRSGGGLLGAAGAAGRGPLSAPRRRDRPDVEAVPPSRPSRRRRPG